MKHPSRSSRATQSSYDRRKTPVIGGPRVPRVVLASRVTRALALVPGSVHPNSWELFVFQVDVARHGGPLTGGALRRAVGVVVAEMRAAAEPWDVIYSALGSAMGDGPAGEVRYAPDDRHVDRAAALVAHMHAWADCVRLDELERDGGEYQPRGPECDE